MGTLIFLILFFSMAGAGTYVFLKHSGFPHPKLVAVSGPVFLFLLIIFGASIKTVDAGEQAVVTRFGKIKGATLAPGVHFLLPFIDQTYTFDTREQKKETDAAAASADLQTVTAKVAVNHHVDPQNVNRLYQEVGKDFENRVVDPAVQESVKAATAQYTASDLITKRPEVKQKIKDSLTTRLAARYIILDDISITNFDFSDAFNAAIEAKQVAAQNVATAQQQLEQAKINAQQTVAQAQAAAEAQRAQQQTLTPELLQKYAIDKWNGQLPGTVTADAVPFLNLGK